MEVPIVPTQRAPDQVDSATLGVVIAAHQAEPWIAETLRSLQAQTHSSWCCVVVDDGSADDTAAVAETFTSDSRITVIRGTHAGVSAARNLGTAALPAEVKVVSYLDSDDTLVPDAFAQLTALLMARPDVVGVYGLAEYLDAEGRPLRPGEHPRRQRDRRRVTGRKLTDVSPTTDLDFDELVVNGPIWPTGVALLRRDVVDEVGGWDPAFVSQQDWELYVRMSRRGSFAPLDSQVAWYRRHDGNTTGRTPLVTRSMAEVRSSAYAHPDNSPAQRTAVANAWRYLSARQAAIGGLDMLVALAGGRFGRARQSGRVMIAQLRLQATRSTAPPSASPPSLLTVTLPVELAGALRVGRRLLNVALR